MMELADRGFVQGFNACDGFGATDFLVVCEQQTPEFLALEKVLAVIKGLRLCQNIVQRRGCGPRDSRCKFQLELVILTREGGLLSLNLPKEILFGLHLAFQRAGIVSGRLNFANVSAALSNDRFLLQATL